MSTHTAMFDGENTSTFTDIANRVGQYWGYLVGFFTGVGIAIAFYRKVCKKRIAAARVWLKNAAEAPTIIVDLKNQLSFANGMTLQDWAGGVSNDLTGIRQMVAFETISRRNLWDTVKDPIFEANETGKFRWANRAFLSMIEGNLKDVLDHNWRNIIAGPDREEVVDGWEMAVRDGSDFKAKFRLATDSGEKWVRFHAVCNKVEIPRENEAGMPAMINQVLGFTGKMWEIPDPRIPGGGIHDTHD